MPSPVTPFYDFSKSIDDPFVRSLRNTFGHYKLSIADDLNCNCNNPDASNLNLFLIYPVSKFKITYLKSLFIIERLIIFEIRRN